MLPVSKDLLQEAGRRLHARSATPVIKIIETLQNAGFRGIYAGVSRLVSTLAAYQPAYEETVRTVRLAKMARVPIMFSEDSLLPLNLLNLQDIGAVGDFVKDVLGGIAHHKHKDCLLHTLKEYIKNDCQLKATARSLHVHINTLRNRLAEIATLMQCDLRSSETLFRIQMALSLYELLPDALLPKQPPGALQEGKKIFPRQ